MLIDFSKSVPAAQKGDEKAMEDICLAFRPLALNLGHKKRYAVLEDNVESLAYCTIIQLVRNYAGSTYQRFPGYIKKMLIFALNNAAKKQQRISYYETNSMDDAEVFAPATMGNEEEQYIERIMLKQAIKKLPLQYRKLLKSYYWEHKTDKEIGQQMEISQQAVSKMREKVLHGLRTFFLS
jgi:RNA polymerase sigma factor (sigma-70 family)